MAYLGFMVLCTCRTLRLHNGIRVTSRAAAAECAEQVCVKDKCENREHLLYNVRSMCLALRYKPVFSGYFLFGLIYPQLFRNHIHSCLQLCLVLWCFLCETVSYVRVPGLRRAVHTARFVVLFSLWAPFINLFITIRHCERYPFTQAHYSKYYKLLNNSMSWFHWNTRTILALHQNTGTKITDHWWFCWLHSVYIVSNVYVYSA